jgi:hypothetical protein
MFATSPAQLFYDVFVSGGPSRTRAAKGRNVIGTRNHGPFGRKEINTYGP